MTENYLFKAKYENLLLKYVPEREIECWIIYIKKVNKFLD